MCKGGVRRDAENDTAFGGVAFGAVFGLLSMRERAARAWRGGGFMRGLGPALRSGDFFAASVSGTRRGVFLRFCGGRSLFLCLYRDEASAP